MSDFEKQIHAMFDHIWDCDINHPVFEDTVGELMDAVIQCYNSLPSADVPDTNVGDMINCTDCIKHGGDWECDHVNCHKGKNVSNTDVDNDVISRKQAIEAMGEEPPVEPEIIRCKDCRFAHLTHDETCKYCDMWIDEFGIPEELYLDGDFYCGYAERRTE